jgi:hypothetical protein
MCNQKLKLVPIDTFEIQAETTAKRLTKKNYPCDFVWLSISNTIGNTSDGFITKDADGSYLESNEEVYWGFNNKALNQIFPAVKPLKIPVKDAGDVYIRCSTKKGGGERKVIVNTFRFKEMEEIKK